jgi:uncharacterized protein YlzI (FlbEa/FlbD family)
MFVALISTEGKTIHLNAQHVVSIEQFDRETHVALSNGKTVFLRDLPLNVAEKLTIGDRQAKPHQE